MIVPDFHITSNLFESEPGKMFRAETIADNLPVILKVLSIDNENLQTIDKYRNDHFVGIGLSQHSRHILKPLEFKQTPGLTYIVYEDFDGAPLNVFLQHHKPTIEEALQISINLADALDEIHRQDRVHLNLAPCNIFISPNNFAIKLSDFRFSTHKTAFGATENVQDTKEHHLGYISPEQTGRLVQKVDYRSDYYSLGIILYEMFCGRIPFESSDPLEVIHSHIARQPLSPHDVDAERCPLTVAKLILKLLAKMPCDRYQSIAGLRHDLELCFQAQKAGVDINDFDLAKHDFSTIFRLPTKLYGRENELANLNGLLNDTCNGRGALVCVSGPAGSGKTALIRELQNQRISDALFCYGKFEQFQNKIPYSAFIQIIDDLVTYLLGESESSFRRYKVELNEMLGNSAGVVTTLAPRFESIVGKQKKPLLLGVNETRNRLQSALSALFSVFVQNKSALVLVIDDLQWADHASLSLVEALLEADWFSKTLTILCYRENAINDNPLLKNLHHRISEHANFNELSFGGLSIDDVALLVSDTLHAGAIEVNSLVKNIYQVTGGNAFYTRQLLTSMNQEGMLWADNTSQKWKWKWKYDSVVNADEEQGTLDLVESTLDKLDKGLLEMLYYGLLLGSPFKLSDIALILEIQEVEIIKKISLLQNYGLLNYNGKMCRFAHDRIQQTVALTMPSEQTSQYHLRIGRQLVKCLSAPEMDNRLFEITNHLNEASDLLSTEQELQNLLLFNIDAISRALNSSAYAIALHYADKASVLLAKVTEEFQQKYIFDTTLMLARCHYLNAQHQVAKKTISDCFRIARAFNQKCTCYSVYKDILVSEGVDYHEAVVQGLRILEQENIPVSENGVQLQKILMALHQRIRKLLGARNPAQLRNIPTIEDPDKISMLGLFADIFEAAYYEANEPLMHYSILSSVATSIEYGNCSESAFGYVLYGMILTLDGHYREAYEFGCLALELNEEFNDRVMLPKVTNLFCNYTNYHIKSFRTSVKLYEKSAKVGQENGDYLFGLWASVFVVWSRFLSGQGLTEVDYRAGELQNFIQQTNDYKMIYVYDVLRDVIRSLAGMDGQNYLIPETHYDAYIKYWQENNFVPGITWHAILMGQYYCFMGQYELAHRQLTQAELVLAPGIIMFPHSQHIFYHSLALLKLLNSNKLSITMEHEKQITASLDQLAQWAELCPDNFLYQKLLVEAENECFNGRMWEASTLYNKAIEAAEKYGVTYALALANELAGDFWRNQGSQKLVDYYTQSAIDYYSVWGGRHKRDILAVKLSGRTGEIIRSTAGFNERLHNFDFQSTDLDFGTVLKFTLAISQEIEADRLLKKTMGIIIENAGADKGILITKHHKTLEVSIVAELHDRPILTQLNIPLDEYQALPQRVIRYVDRTGESVLLDDALQSDIYQDLSYIQEHTIHSILCQPVIYKNETQAILYLENRSTSGVFNEQQISTLRLLLAQLAISLKNAQLYHSLESELARHKETMKALELSKERLRLSHEYANVGAWDWNIEANSLYWSEGIFPLLGYKQGELEPTLENFVKAIHPEDRQTVLEAKEACFAGDDYQAEHRVVWPNGSVHWVLELGDVTRDDNGQPVRMLGITKDITDIKHNTEERLRLEKQLQQAQKMETVGQLTGGIAHDFNNMLASILGFGQLLEIYVEDKADSTIKEYVQQIIESGERAGNLIAQMLAFSRGDDTKKQNTDIISVARQTVSMLSSTMPSSLKINITYDTNTNIPVIKTNMVQVNQMLMNICINARDAFASQYGQININVEHRRQLSGECSSCHSRVSGDYVILSVKDNAGGIPANIQEQIFYPFFTTKKVGKGTGLGLSMVHGIMHSHDGHIMLEVEDGVGSEFRLLFPVSA